MFLGFVCFLEFVVCWLAATTTRPWERPFRGGVVCASTVRKEKENKNKNSGSGCGACPHYVLPWHVPGQFSCPSQLSGSHGEWTMGDDLDHPARVRVNKEARTNRHRSGGGPKRKVQHGPKASYADAARRFQDLENRFDCLRDGAEPDPGEEPPAPVPRPVMLVRTFAESPHHKYAWDGLQFLHRHRAHYLDPSGRICVHHVQDGTVIRGPEGGDGWALQGDDGRPMMEWSLKNPIVPFETPAWEHLGQAIPAERGLRLKMAVRAIAVEFPSSGRVDHARIKAVTAFLTKRYAALGCSNRVISGTVKWWLYHECLARSGLIESTAVHRVLGGVLVSPADAGIVRRCSLLRVQTDFTGQYREDGVECVLPDDYAFKRTYDVRGFGCTVDVENQVYPVFDTQKPPDGLAKYYRTVFCSFQGHCEPFLLYDVSANNATKAVKRLLAARDREPEYYVAQASVLRAISDKYILKEVLDTLRIRVEHDVAANRSHYVIGGPRANHHLDWVELERPERKPFRVAAKHLTARCNRTYVTRFVERMLALTPVGAFGDLGRAVQAHVAVAGANVREWAHWDYYAGFCNYLEYLETDVGRLTNADIDHVKKALRWAYVTNVVFHHDDDIMVERLNGAVKRELAKYGKVPRIYVSYQAGCMYANEIPELVKVALDAPFHYRAGELVPDLAVRIHIMAKPKDDSLSVCFSQLMEATLMEDTLVVVIYSDDSVYAGRVRGVSFGFNVDISSCDASNNSLVFALAGTCLAGFSKRRACGLLKQCMLPITIRNPNNPSEKLVVDFHSAFEGSGTVLTTVLNHVASYLIAVGVAIQLSSGLAPEPAIEAGAAMVGHKVTCESWCDDGAPVFEKIQFLKHSPVLSTTGEWVPTLNFGCVLRSLGSIEGDLEPKHFGVTPSEFRAIPIQDRMDRFLGGVIKGLVHEPESRVMCALRSRFVDRGETTLDIRRGVLEVSGSVPSSRYERSAFLGIGDAMRMKDRSKSVLCEESLCRRYDIAQGDIDELVGHILEMKLGSVSVTAAATNFYRVDYGVPTVGLLPE